MPHDATLHVKLDSATDGQLKKLAYERGKSKGQLVREALSACYQTTMDELPLRQRRAIAAYQGGYISLGRLARDMGMHVLELRDWLKEHGIALNTALSETDASHA